MTSLMTGNNLFQLIVKELDRMLTQGIITQVDEPTEWVNNQLPPRNPRNEA